MTESVQARLVEALEETQRRHGGYLPEPAMRALAADLGVPAYHLFGVASFFPHFRLTPPPALELSVCTDMVCHLRGARRLLEDLQAATAGRPPSEVEVRTVSCLGRCDGAPAVAVNDRPYWGLVDGQRAALVEAVCARGPLPDPPLPTPLTGLRADPYAGRRPTYDALRNVIQTGDVAGALATLKASQLRGMGGAGFSAAMKWQLVRDQPGDVKYVVCNADESEPGTIKDRGILTSAPHLLVEGMALAGVITGAKRGIVYIRHEYALEARLLDEAIQAARRDGVIGPSVLGSPHVFELEIFTSPGGYICGEESALLEALEGRRAQPRLKPPFPVTHGLFGRPTVINNVETLSHAPVILLRGADWYVAQGRGAPGFKFVGISGGVTRPGVYEVPIGTTFRQLIDEKAGGVMDGRPLKAFAPTGPSGGFLPGTMADTPIEWGALQKAGSMLGSCAIVAIAEGACMVDLALNVARFFARESCGKCWPCRVGSEKFVLTLERITHGTGTDDSIAALREMEPTLAQTSICGLGQVVPKPISSVMQHFPDEVAAHVRERRCPAGVCPMRPQRVMA